MKQHDVLSTKEIGGNTFYIRPFPAFTAVNISGELGAIFAPTIAGVVPIAMSTEEGKGIADLDVSSIGNALSSLSGDRVESLMKKLLTKHGNISVDYDGTVKVLDNDIANEIFCGAAQDMFILAAEVINVNYKGFFSKLADQFGLRKSDETTQTPLAMETLT